MWDWIVNGLTATKNWVVEHPILATSLVILSAVAGAGVGLPLVLMGASVAAASTVGVVFGGCVLLGGNYFAIQHVEVLQDNNNLNTQNASLLRNNTTLQTENGENNATLTAHQTAAQRNAIAYNDAQDEIRRLQAELALEQQKARNQPRVIITETIPVTNVTEIPDTLFPPPNIRQRSRRGAAPEVSSNDSAVDNKCKSL